MHRTAGLWSIATVLEAIDGFTNYYKCRRARDPLPRASRCDAYASPRVLRRICSAITFAWLTWLSRWRSCLMTII